MSDMYVKSLLGIYTDGELLVCSYRERYDTILYLKCALLVVCSNNLQEELKNKRI